MSAALLITTGTWNVEPFVTGPGEFNRKFAFGPDAAGSVGGGAVSGGGGGGAAAASVPRLVCGTSTWVPALAFNCASAAGAAAEADLPGTVPTVELEITGCNWG